MDFFRVLSSGTSASGRGNKRKREGVAKDGDNGGVPGGNLNGSTGNTAPSTSKPSDDASLTLKAFLKSHAIRTSSKASLIPPLRSVDDLFTSLETSLSPLANELAKRAPAHGSGDSYINAILDPLRANLGAVASQLTPIQMQAVPVMLNSRDLLAISPTGSGKTLAYLLPLVNLAARAAIETSLAEFSGPGDVSASEKSQASRTRGPVAIVLAPTVELCAQIRREASKLVEEVRVPVLSRKEKGGSGGTKRTWRNLKVCLLTTYGVGVFGKVGKETDRGDEGDVKRSDDSGEDDDDSVKEEGDEEEHESDSNEEDDESESKDEVKEEDNDEEMKSEDSEDDDSDDDADDSDSKTKPPRKARQLASQLAFFDIIVSTPARLLHILSSSPSTLLHQVLHLVLDEADRLLSLDDIHHNTVTSLVSLEDAGRPADEGRSFLHQVDKVLEACGNKGLRKACFSATVPSGVEEMARSVMDADVVTVRIGGAAVDRESSNSPLPRIHQKLVFCSSEAGKLMEIRQMLGRGDVRPPCLIFVQSKKRAEELREELAVDGRSVDVVTGERTKKERDNLVRLFRTGHLHLLICTDLLSRGLDFSAVRTVINYDFPSTTAAYVHRIGRTGRAGREGWAFTFFTHEDAPYVKSVANVMKEMGEKIEDWMVGLDKPSREAKKNMKQKGVKRESIDTRPKKEKRREQAKKEMIEASKRRKRMNDGGKVGYGKKEHNNDDE